MKKMIMLAVSVLALGACGSADDPAATGAETGAEAGTATETAATADDTMLAGEEAGFEAIAPGTYEVTRADGSVDYIEIGEGLTYARVAADGTATGGTIFMQGGRICFVVEGVEGQNCFRDGPRQPDGSLQTTSKDGEVSSVRPVEGALGDHVGGA